MTIKIAGIHRLSRGYWKVITGLVLVFFSSVVLFLNRGVSVETARLPGAIDSQGGVEQVVSPGSESSGAAPATPSVEMIMAPVGSTGVIAQRAPSVIDEQRQRSLADRLPGEGVLLAGETVDLSAAEHVLTSEASEFSQAVAQLKAQSLNDSLASELDQIYRDGLEMQLQSAATEGRATLDEFACGLRLCLGSVRAPAPGIQPPSIGDLLDAAGLQSHSLVENPVAVDGLEQMRFIIATDPTSNEVSLTTGRSYEIISEGERSDKVIPDGG